MSIRRLIAPTHCALFIFIPNTPTAAYTFAPPTVTPTHGSRPPRAFTFFKHRSIHIFVSFSCTPFCDSPHRRYHRLPLCVNLSSMIPSRNPAPQRMILWGAFFVFLIAAASIGISDRHRLIRRDAANSSRTVNDFDRWMTLVPLFIHHHADYLNDDFPNPPIALAMLAPFTLISPANAQMACALLKFLLIWTTLLIVLRILRESGGYLRPAVLALVLFIWLWPIISDLCSAQINFLMLLPLVASLALLQSSTRRNDLVAGLLLALAISVKVTPLVFLPYLVVQRRWTALLAALFGLLLWLLLVPAILFGWDQNLTWLHQWTNIMFLPYLQHGAVVYIDNQSLPSSIFRFCTSRPAFSTVAPDGVRIPHYFNIIALSPPAAALLARAMLATIGIIGLIWLHRPLRTFRTPFFLRSIGAIAVFMLLASERSWIHHFVTIILPLVAVGMFVGNPASTRLQHAAALAILILAAFTFPLTTDIGLLFGRAGPLFANSLGSHLFPALAMLLFLGIAGHRAISSPPNRDSPESTTPGELTSPPPLPSH
ncbi:MAG TPA: glycosyltransferase family 87 protein [Phycisphaerae bacterium]|nr:glycosyltransferase family 87 protein [Phycisphaerae bacterium]